MSIVASIGKGAAKHRQVCILQMRLDELRPACINDQIYKPVDRRDPAVQSLADDIRRTKYIDPILITEDKVIISGHRRRVACQILGMEIVPVEIFPITSDEPQFEDLLVSANNQRVKTTDEMLREECVRYCPEESHRRLIEHRKSRSDVDGVETIKIVGMKRRCKIGKAKGAMLEAMLQVLRDNRDFLPLTLRRVHYLLVSRPQFLRNVGKPVQYLHKGKWRNNVYCNDLDSYKDLSNLLTRARHEGIVPWSWIHDPTRPVTAWDCHANVQEFTQEQLKNFLANYQRDYLQSQPNQIELIGEKLTLDGVIRPVVAQYGIRITTGRGYSSYTVLKQMAERFLKSGKQNLVTIFVSDFDPEGEDAPHAFVRCLRDDHGIPESRLVPVKIALTSDQVKDPELALTPQMKVKKSSSRCKGFQERYGDDVFEVEAVPPRKLQSILRAGIDSVLDLDAFNAEIDKEEEEAAVLENMQWRMQHTMQQALRSRKQEGND
jgi:hypothetical protein